MLATAPHAITAIKREGSVIKAESAHRRLGPLDLTDPPPARRRNLMATEGRGGGGYRSACGRPGRTGARRGCRA